MTRLISNSGFRISVRDSSRRLLRHGAGEPSAVPLEIRAIKKAASPAFAGKAAVSLLQLFGDGFTYSAGWAEFPGPSAR